MNGIKVIVPKSIENAKFKEFVSSYSFNHDFNADDDPQSPKEYNASSKTEMNLSK